jgi:hypothetical protein
MGSCGYVKYLAQRPAHSVSDLHMCAVPSLEIHIGKVNRIYVKPRDASKRNIGACLCDLKSWQRHLGPQGQWEIKLEAKLILLYTKHLDCVPQQGGRKHSTSESLASTGYLGA